MGSRQKKRFRMVLPVSIWGTDSSGKTFHQLAYTLDISTGGARLAGVQATLQHDQVIAVRYRQRKARFRVVWAVNKEVGIQYLEGEKFIWIQLPEEEFVDKFTPEPLQHSPLLPEDRELPGGNLDSRQAAIELRRRQDPEDSALLARLTSTTGQDSPDDLAAALEKCMAVLRALDHLVSSAGVVSCVAREFHAAAGHLRNSAWAVQQWIELHQESKDAANVIESVNSERVRFATQLCRELVTQQQHVGAGVSQETREALVAAVQALAEQLGIPVPEHLANGTRQEANSLDSVALLAELNDEIRSSTLSTEEALNLIVERARSFTHAQGAAVALTDGEGMTCCASAGIAPLVGSRFSAAGGLTGEAILTRRPVFWCDTEQGERVDAGLCRSLNLRSSAIVPIANQGSVVGVLQVFASRPNAFDENSVSLLQRLAEFVTSLKPGQGLEVDPR